MSATTDSLEAVTKVNDALYRDIVLADAKAAFSMSISAVSVAAMASLLSVDSPLSARVLEGCAFGIGAAGVAFAVVSVLLSVVTVLPRRRTAAGDAGGLGADVLSIITSLFTSPDAGSDRIEALVASPSVENWHAENGRLARVRRRKYWWVGVSISSAGLGLLCMILAVVCAVLSGSDMELTKIVSGGQTGVDRAALDAARVAGKPYGGYVPAGRAAEDGRLPDDYVGMVETGTDVRAERTELNVVSSDATIIFSRGPLRDAGSLLTARLAVSHKRPHRHIDLATTTEEDAVANLREWLTEHTVRTLNVAGPPASEDPSLYAPVLRIVTELLRGPGVN